MPTASRDLLRLSRNDRARGEDEMNALAGEPLPADIRVIAEAAIWEGSNERTATIRRLRVCALSVFATFFELLSLSPAVVI